MAAGDKYVTCENSMLTLLQLFGELIYEDANGQPYLKTD